MRKLRLTPTMLPFRLVIIFKRSDLQSLSLPPSVLHSFSPSLLPWEWDIDARYTDTHKGAKDSRPSSPCVHTKVIMCWSSEGLACQTNSMQARDHAHCNSLVSVPGKRTNAPRFSLGVLSAMGAHTHTQINPISPSHLICNL